MFLDNTEVRQQKHDDGKSSYLIPFLERAMRNTSALVTTNTVSINDLLNLCKQYAMLGWNIQAQVEAIMTLGVAEAIDSGLVSVAALPHIKDFLSHITSQAYFGVAAFQADECLEMLEGFENTHPNLLGDVAN